MFKDLIAASRSFRSFDRSVGITPEQLADFIDCARLSPSSMNLQTLKFHPVSDKAECDIVLSNVHWAGKLRDLHLPPKGHEPVAYIVICSDSAVTDGAERFQKDVGICAQSVMLAAVEAGFGGCMMSSFTAEKLRNELSLPANLVPQLVLALGKPDETVRIADEAADGSVTYYRENGIHYVQKRSLKELIV